MKRNKIKRKKKKKNGFKKFWKLGFEEFNTQHFDINPDGELVVREGNFQYNNTLILILTASLLSGKETSNTTFTISSKNTAPARK